jgi:hypothetical protein
MLDRARELLVYEISEVISGTAEEAERQVDMALKARALQAKANFITDKTPLTAPPNVKTGYV